MALAVIEVLQVPHRRRIRRPDLRILKIYILSAVNVKSDSIPETAHYLKPLNRAVNPHILQKQERSHRTTTMDMNSSQVLVPGSVLSKILTPIFDLCTPTPPPKEFNPQEQSPLMRLTAELRNRIYHFALLNGSDEADADDIPNSEGRIELRTLHRPVLTKTCRLIQVESLPYFFRYAKFVYTIKVSLSPKLHVKHRAARSWLSTTVRELPIHDIVYRVQIPEECNALPSCPVLAARMQSTGLDQVSSTMDFLSINGSKPPLLILAYKRVELQMINEEQGRELNLQRWEAIESLARGGLQVGNVEAVAHWVRLMSNLQVCETWGVYLFGLVLGEGGRKKLAPALKAIVRAGLLCACVDRKAGMAKEIEDANRKAGEEGPRMMDRTRRWL